MRGGNKLMKKENVPESKNVKLDGKEDAEKGGGTRRNFLKMLGLGGLTAAAVGGASGLLKTKDASAAVKKASGKKGGHNTPEKGTGIPTGPLKLS